MTKRRILAENRHVLPAALRRALSQRHFPNAPDIGSAGAKDVADVRASRSDNTSRSATTISENRDPRGHRRPHPLAVRSGGPRFGVVLPDASRHARLSSSAFRRSGSSGASPHRLHGATPVSSFGGNSSLACALRLLAAWPFPTSSRPDQNSISSSSSSSGSCMAASHHSTISGCAMMRSQYPVQASSRSAL